MSKRIIWSTYECSACGTQHEMRGSPAQLTRQGATRCPNCHREMCCISQRQETPHA
jgi:DNA-directed RNA polymerase subunit RPC12/RpoP